ncbi:MAG: histidine phosphatase family protein [Deltaproteobacteria bacterium]|nr:histidine phosphatase family protein [Deltaproteobacteria bacterium]
MSIGVEHDKGMSNNLSMLPRTLLLARHGETDWNRSRRLQGHTDIPLNDLGRRQAHRLADRLAGSDIAAIQASDLVRAAETAKILGEALGLEPALQSAWREIDLGDLEGQDGVETTRAHGELISAAARADGPLGRGGESFRDFHARIVAGYERICRDHADRTVLLVSHGGTLKALIAHLIGLDPVQIGRLSLRGNTSLSTLDFQHGRPQLTLLNCTSHLE